MPRKCSVYGCKSNYDSTEERYSVFTFRRDETLRREWIRTIPNMILTPTKYTCVYHYTIRILKDLSKYLIFMLCISTLEADFLKVSHHNKKRLRSGGIVYYGEQ